ncbi:snare-like protein, partial [Thelephora ganbajun]
HVQDRHCTCVYYQDWHRSRKPKPAVPGGILPAVNKSLSPATITGSYVQDVSPRSTLSINSGVVIAVNDDDPNFTQHPNPLPSGVGGQPPTGGGQSTGLSFDEEAKLVYGVVLSLRNMIKKLSGRDEQFVDYKTSAYKLHLYETISGYKFVMLSDPEADSLRTSLHSIYAGPFLDYVVRNPLVSMDSKERGIDNEYFRTATDRAVKSIPFFSF